MGGFATPTPRSRDRNNIKTTFYELMIHICGLPFGNKERIRQETIVQMTTVVMLEYGSITYKYVKKFQCTRNREHECV